MFDFGSDGRNHGGDPGVNHKGLVTFDHKTKKDSFYICKAYWSKEPFVHICGKRFEKRNKKNMILKVYSNQSEVALYVNDRLVTKKAGQYVFKFKVKVEGEIKVRAVSNNVSDSASFIKVNQFPEEYKLHTKSNNYSWEK
jgi:beta-galactosidase